MYNSLRKKKKKEKVAGHVWACLLTERQTYYLDQTSCRILAWGGADIIQRKTGLFGS